MLSTEEALTELQKRLREKTRKPSVAGAAPDQVSDNGEPAGLPAHVPWSAANLITGSGSGPELGTSSSQV